MGKLQELFNKLDKDICEIRFEGTYGENDFELKNASPHTDITWGIFSDVCAMFDVEKHLFFGIVKHKKGDIPNTLPIGWLAEYEDNKGNFKYKKVGMIVR